MTFSYRWHFFETAHTIASCMMDCGHHPQSSEDSIAREVMGKSAIEVQHGMESDKERERMSAAHPFASGDSPSAKESSRASVPGVSNTKGGMKKKSPHFVAAEDVAIVFSYVSVRCCLDNETGTDDVLRLWFEDCKEKISAHMRKTHVNQTSFFPERSVASVKNRACVLFKHRKILMNAIREFHPILPVDGNQVTPSVVWDVYQRYLAAVAEEGKNQATAVCRGDFDLYKLKSAGDVEDVVPIVVPIHAQIAVANKSACPLDRSRRDRVGAIATAARYAIEYLGLCDDDAICHVLGLVKANPSITSEN